MSTASIIFLTVLFGGFIIAVILIYKKRKKLREKIDTNPHLYDHVFTQDDAPADHDAVVDDH